MSPHVQAPLIRKVKLHSRMTQLFVVEGEWPFEMIVPNCSFVFTPGVIHTSLRH